MVKGMVKRMVKRMVDLTSYKRLSRVLVLLCAMIGATGVLAQTGPGGVGDATSNILWLSADNITGLADGNDITTWTDGSGNSNDLTQSDSSLNPIYKTNILNGLPAVRFNKSNGRIRRNNFTTFPTTAITEIYVNSNNEGANDGILSYASEADDNDFMLMGSRSLRIHKKEGTLDTSVSVSDGNFHIVNASWRSSDGSTEVWKDGFKEWTRSNWQVGDPITSGGNFAIAGDQDSIDGGYQANQAHFGDFTEVLIFNTYLNTAQHIIVNNYLASKYALSIANDKYSYDGSLQTDVAGIGREDASSQHVDAQSAGILAVNTPSSLDDGDYLLFGHDNGAINAWTSTEIPSTGKVIKRLVREWRFDETGNVGTIKFTVDTALLPAETTPNTTYALLVDADGDFSDGAAVYEMNSPGNNSFYETAANIAIADGDYVALSIIRVNWEPSDITTALWLDAADGSTLFEDSGTDLAEDADGIAQWNDKSSNARNVGQTRTDRRPSYEAAGWSNGNGQLRLDSYGAQKDSLGRDVSSDGISAAAATLFVAVDAESEDNEEWIHTSSTTDSKENRAQINNNEVKFRSDASNGGSASGVYVSGEQILQFTLASTSSEVRRNGTQIAGNNGTYAASTLTGNFTVNGRSSSQGHAGMKGAIGEFIYLSSNPSADTRQKMEGYLSHKWGLETSLPSDHPYLLNAPLTSAAAVAKINASAVANDASGITLADIASVDGLSFTPIAANLSTYQTVIANASGFADAAAIDAAFNHPMLITVNTALGLTVDIRLFGTVSGVTIDWGDGTTPTTGINTAGTNSHTYGSAGNYVIEIDGNFTGYGWEGATPTAANVAAITGVTQWNLVGGASTLISLRGAFRDHVNLITVPDTLLSTIVLLPKAFLGATSFNHDISGWDTSSVSDFSQMFNEAISFNQDIGGWNTATGVDFSKMFRKAMSFNQDLSSWDTASATDMLNMFKLARLSVDNYDRLITAWDSVQGTTLNNLNFHGGSSLFCEAIDPDVPDGNKDCAPQIVRTTLADDATTITVTWSKPVFTNIDGTGALTVNDYVLAITAGSSGTPATLISTTPTSISQNGNSYTLGLDLSGTLQPDQVISVLPAQ